MAIFPCPACKGWHLTSNLKRYAYAKENKRFAPKEVEHDDYGEFD